MAQALAHVGGDDLVCVGRPNLDLADGPSLLRAVEDIAPNVVINAAAYTNVDQAESEPGRANTLNADGPKYLALACAKAGAALIHLSTDCVFDGTLDRAYSPADQTAPLNAYGRSKLEGEAAVASAMERHLIVRVSWIFSQFANNFVRTMLTLAETRNEVSVVSDQRGCPTYAPALAKALLDMADQVCAPDFADWGIYHLAGKGETNRALMSEAIFAESRAQGGPDARVLPVLTENYPTPATRPLNARLDMSAARDVFGIDLPDWQEGLRQTVSYFLENRVPS
jgi:dTDP-4-dehydrorhamnose reductase